MKISVLLAFAIAAPAAFAGELLPQGTFTGTGEWRGADGSSGQYTVVTTAKGDEVTSRYVYDQGAQGRREQVTTYALSSKGNGFFEVQGEQGKVVGRGYCLEQQCFWTTEFPGGKVEESLRWDGVSLDKLGGKSGPGFSVVWREKLSAK